MEWDKGEEEDICHLKTKGKKQRNHSSYISKMLFIKTSNFLLLLKNVAFFELLRSPLIVLLFLLDNPRKLSIWV